MTTEVVGTVEKKSAFGIMVNGQWFNINKFAKPAPDLSGVNRGDTVTMKVSGGKYISSITGGGGVATATTTGTSTTTAPASRGYTSTTREEIARSTAVKAVLGSTILHSVYEGEADKGKVAAEVKELCKQVTNYILTGDWFEKVEVKTSEDVESLKVKGE